MCGRTVRASSKELLEQLFELSSMPDVLPVRYNLAPTDLLPVIRKPHVLELLRWGFTMPDPKQAGINARIESLAWKAYREPLKNGRCVVVVDAFYEWKKVNGEKRPQLIHRQDGHPLMLAGMVDGANAVTVITKPSDGALAEVHARMPAMLERDAMGAWLDPSVADVMPLLRAANGNAVTFYPVSTRVGSVRNDDASLIERVDEAEGEPPKGRSATRAKQLGLF